ncbi:MAG: hypothetical protein R2879_00110 [Saprospiraceae bacterium]
MYIGSTAGYTPNLFPAGFCGSIENNQWLAFVAGSTTASVTITSWNCRNGQGVQLYMTDVNLVPVSSCFSSKWKPCSPDKSHTGLFPGEVYYIMIDGFAGDVCDIQINIIGGVTTGPPDLPSDIEPEFDEDPCPGQTVCYEVPTVNGATNYNWTVDGDGEIIVADRRKINLCVVEFGDDGSLHYALQSLFCWRRYLYSNKDGREKERDQLP